jgi:hypothetical protein
MVQVTNNTRDELSFNTTGKPKDGHPQTDSIPAGETKDIDVDVEDPRFKGFVLAGAVSVPAAVARKAGAVPEPTGRK